MEHNADFSRRASDHDTKTTWIPSPMPGVERRMLDRIGDEVARATSVVRYAAGSHFSPHVHTGGEEFVVLEGVFSDEHGDFGPGSYIRNPPGSKHQPGSADGCTIFVKLWQFDPDDAVTVRLMEPPAYVETASGVSVAALYTDAHEDVAFERWSAEQPVVRDAGRGLELFVLEGSFTMGSETFGPQSWLRLPPGDTLEARAGASGATVWRKAGHLDGARARFEAAFARADA
ncbi:MAG: cupin domain-containing protein [Myxococcota bacterium]